MQTIQTYQEAYFNTKLYFDATGSTTSFKLPEQATLANHLASMERDNTTMPPGGATMKQSCVNLRENIPPIRKNQSESSMSCDNQSDNATYDFYS